MGLFVGGRAEGGSSEWGEDSRGELGGDTCGSGLSNLKAARAILYRKET